MARSLRIQYPGALYYVTHRGNERKSIFGDNKDSQRFLEIFAQSVEIYDIRTYSFVLMSNHFHLLVETPLGNLGEFMRHFNITYTSHFNRRHKRTGPLYQGRYKSVLIEKDAYFSLVSRYIHLNPVRVRDITKKPVEVQLDVLWNYKWSSLPGYFDLRSRYDFIDYTNVLEEFGGDTPKGREMYKKLIGNDALEGLSIKDKIIGQSLLGGDDFISRINEKFLNTVKDREMPAIRVVHSYAEKDKIIQATANVLGISSEELLKTSGVARYITMDLLYRIGGLKNREIGEVFGVDYSTVSQGRKRLRQRKEHDERLRALLRKIEQLLSVNCQE